MKQIEKILKPTFQYLALMVSLYVMRDVMDFPFFGMLMIIPLIIIVVLPIVLLIWNIRLVRSTYKKVNSLQLFLFSLIPGFLFGIQFAYGFHLMGHGTISISVIIPFLFVGLISGLFFGIFGLLINFVINLFAKK